MERPAYPFEEFFRHFDELNAGDNLRRGQWMENVLAVFDYMKTQCDDPNEAQHKAQRFVLILEYLSEHIHDFDQADYAVYGSETAGALAGEHLLPAVHEVFTTPDLGKLGHGPSADQIMRLADKYRGQSSGE